MSDTRTCRDGHEAPVNGRRCNTCSREWDRNRWQQQRLDPAYMEARRERGRVNDRNRRERKRLENIGW